MVIIVDDEARENEGDLVCAADLVTPEIINFMASKGKGLICLPMSTELCQKYDLQMMTNNNRAANKTASQYQSKLPKVFLQEYLQQIDLIQLRQQ